MGLKKDIKGILNKIATEGYGEVNYWQIMTAVKKHTKKKLKTVANINNATQQKFIDQGQSLNLMVAPNVPMKEVNQLMIYAWENGLKGLYYQRSANPSQELARSILNCSSCEG